jgi:hypothetical protein
MSAELFPAPTNSLNSHFLSMMISYLYMNGADDEQAYLRAGISR